MENNAAIDKWSFVKCNEMKRVPFAWASRRLQVQRSQALSKAAVLNSRRWSWPSSAHMPERPEARPCTKLESNRSRWKVPGAVGIPPGYATGTAGRRLRHAESRCRCWIHVPWSDSDSQRFLKPWKNMKKIWNEIQTAWYTGLRGLIN